MAASDWQVKDHLRGVSLGVLTPFDDGLDVNHDKLEENLQMLYSQGIRTFLTVANISEYHSLCRQERIDIAATSVETLPSDACILAGVGGSTADARELIQAYDQLGVDAMMIMPPHHTYVHEQGILEYYRELTVVTERPIVPYIRNFNPSSEFLGNLTRVDGVVGIKYALKNPVKLGAGIAAGDNNVVWINGLAEPFTIAYWAEGVEGFSAGVSNFRPEVGLELFDALSGENWERARKLRNICLPYQNFREGLGKDNTIKDAISVPAVKKGLDLAGLHGGRVREPIKSLCEEDEQRAEELYQELDDNIDRII